MNAFSWLSDLITFFGKLFPRILIVKKTHAGVAFINGKKIKKLLPDLHIYWPIRTEIQLYPVVRQTVNLATQALMTSCGTTIAVGGILVYDVNDVEKALTQTWDLDETIKDIAQVSVRNVIITKSLEELCANRKEIDKQLTEEAKQELKTFGINTIRLSVSDLAKCIVINNIGGNMINYLPKLEEMDDNTGL